MHIKINADKGLRLAVETSDAGTLADGPPVLVHIRPIITVIMIEY